MTAHRSNYIPLKLKISRTKSSKVNLTIASTSLNGMDRKKIEEIIIKSYHSEKALHITGCLPWSGQLQATYHPLVYIGSLHTPSALIETLTWIYAYNIIQYQDSPEFAHIKYLKSYVILPNTHSKVIINIKLKQYLYMISCKVTTKIDTNIHTTKTMLLDICEWQNPYTMFLSLLYYISFTYTYIFYIYTFIFIYKQCFIPFLL